jgi:penicillin-binding protein 1B
MTAGEKGKLRRKKERTVKVPKNARFVRFLLGPVGKTLLALLVVAVLVAGGVFIHFYNTYAKLIDQRLKGGAYTATSRIFASPQPIAVGDAGGPVEIASALRRAGYSENRKNATGYYQLQSDAIDIFPGADSYFAQEPAAVRFTKGHISRIVSLADNTTRPMYELEPELITNLYDRNREKQRIVRYEDIPVTLRNAILAAEDKRFFSHSGFDPIGIIRTAYVDVRRGRMEQGASTLSMQLSRYMFLTLSRTWKRKAAEVLITMQLEQRLTKEQIFELYCNQVDLGRRGSFMIRGFGEAAQVYFGKDIRSLTNAEAATLAGMLRSASYYSPYRHPDRLLERRNAVLSLMRDDKFISDRDYAVASEAPLKVVSGPSESSDAPYFVDLINDELERRFPNHDFQANSDRIYTTLDLNLQRAANEAVSIGMKLVDEQVKKQKRFKNAPLVEPQAALIALDPHTGQIKALVGGRNYGVSQLNHVLAERQPGSIFKAFVYAAAMNTGVEKSDPILTPASIVIDEPTTFRFDDQEYSPNNFEHEFYGPVTLRKAISKSLNVATIKVAEEIGYRKVVDLAHASGISEDVKPTPAMAIGSYVATPLEMAGAYTTFANGGVHVQPSMIAMLKEPGGKVMYTAKPETKRILDPRANYLLVNLLEEVMRSGTAAGVRSRGFVVPAAGKTGTSHDGWFAGFTSDLLCIVWVGFDDNRELDIEGARSALPIWTEFMKRAITYRQYSNAKPFDAPDGIVTINVDSQTGMAATSACPEKKPEVFIAGTEPVGFCPLHGGKGDQTIVSGWDVPSAETAEQKPGVDAATPRQPPTPSQISQNNVPLPIPYKSPVAPEPATPPKKKGFFGRLKDVFK